MRRNLPKKSPRPSRFTAVLTPPPTACTLATSCHCSRCGGFSYSAIIPLPTQEILERNITCVKVQLAKLLDFETKQNPAQLVDNASWTANISFLDFLRDIGKHFSVNQMVAKESIRARMEDREVGISYTEFSYMLASRSRSSPMPTAQNSARPKPAPSGSTRNARASINFTSFGSTRMTVTSSVT